MVVFKQEKKMYNKKKNNNCANREVRAILMQSAFG